MRFNYGIIESANKPSPIVLTKKSNLISQRAVQTRCLITFLPLIISDIITEANEQSESDSVSQKWKVLLLLLQIMQIVFSPVVTSAMLAELKELITAHHSLYLECFRSHLLPKHHLMLHYPLVLKLMGPLIFLWTLRFEVKHNYFKDLMKKIKHFKNAVKLLSEQQASEVYVR